ncbi:MAG: TIGR02678 family protein [Mycobacteriales bacterium]
MVESLLAADLADERSRAARVLLATPLLNAATDADAFRLVVRQAPWLTTFFEEACGWTLVVDANAGFARLGKRPVGAPDTSRPLRRARGSGGAFNRRRYQLLCLACAELVRHPVTTIGLLAAAVTPVAGLDTSRYGERGAFVDALRTLICWGTLRVSSGEVEAFVDNERANAILIADTVRLHRLLVSAVAPSALPADLDVDAAIERLLAEPRYGDPSPEGAEVGSDEARHRWTRHRLGRRLLDDPVTYLDELTEAERDYLASPGGRRWVRDRVTEAGFELEERAEGLLAVDPDGLATDQRFPAPLGNAHQLALLLVDRLAPDRRLSPAQLAAAVEEILARYPSWARGARQGDGAEHLTDEAVELLVGFGLARTEPDGSLRARPALTRYRVDLPTTPSLFEDPASTRAEESQ